MIDIFLEIGLCACALCAPVARKQGPSFVDWQCRARPLDGGAATPQVPPMPATACLWRIVIPLADLAAASTPLPPPDVP